MITKKLLHHYRKFRRHQMATYAKSGLHVGGVDQHQHTGGGAAYGEHAIAAFAGARAHVHFLADLKKIAA